MRLSIWLLSVSVLTGFILSGCGDPSEYSLPTNLKTGKKFEVGRQFTQEAPKKDEDGNDLPDTRIKVVKVSRYKKKGKKAEEGNPETELKVRDQEIVDYLNKYKGTHWQMSENRDVIFDPTGMNHGKIKHIPNLSYFDTTALPEPNEVYYVHPKRLAENSAKVFLQKRDKILALFKEYKSDFYIEREVNKERKALGEYDPITRLNWSDELPKGIKDPDQSSLVLRKTKEFDFEAETGTADFDKLDPEYFTRLQNLFRNLAQHIRNVEAQTIPYPDPPFKTKSTSPRATDLETNYNIENAENIRRLNLSERKEFELFGHVPIEVDPGSISALRTTQVKEMFFEVWNQINIEPGGEKRPILSKEEMSPGLEEFRKKVRLDPESGNGTQGSIRGMASEVTPRETEVIAAVKEFVQGLLAKVQKLQEEKEDQLKQAEAKIVIPDIGPEEGEDDSLEDDSLEDDSLEDDSLEDDSTEDKSTEDKSSEEKSSSDDSDDSDDSDEENGE